MVVARCAADVATVGRTRFDALHSQMTVVEFSRVHVHFVEPASPYESRWSKVPCSLMWQVAPQMGDDRQG